MFTIKLIRKQKKQFQLIPTRLAIKSNNDPQQELEEHKYERTRSVNNQKSSKIKILLVL